MSFDFKIMKNGRIDGLQKGLFCEGVFDKDQGLVTRDADEKARV